MYDVERSIHWLANRLVQLVGRIGDADAEHHGVPYLRGRADCNADAVRTTSGAMSSECSATPSPPGSQATCDGGWTGKNSRTRRQSAATDSSQYLPQNSRHVLIPEIAEQTGKTITRSEWKPAGTGYSAISPGARADRLLHAFQKRDRRIAQK